MHPPGICEAGPGVGRPSFVQKSAEIGLNISPTSLGASSQNMRGRLHLGAVTFSP